MKTPLTNERKEVSDMWPFKRKGTNKIPDFGIVVPPPIPLEQLPDEKMTIVYVMCDSWTKKVIKGKELYHTTKVEHSYGVYNPGHFTYVFGNRDHGRPLFTIATDCIISIEIIQKP